MLRYTVQTLLKSMLKIKLFLNETIHIFFKHENQSGITPPPFFLTLSMLSSSVVDYVFGPQSCQTKDYKIFIGCFSV
jgi:hypothetical protein